MKRTRVPPRTKWTRRVPHPVLIGHAVSRGRRGAALGFPRVDGRQGAGLPRQPRHFGACPGAPASLLTAVVHFDPKVNDPNPKTTLASPGARAAARAHRGVRRRRRRSQGPPRSPLQRWSGPRTDRTRLVPPPVLIGHAASASTYHGRGCRSRGSTGRHQPRATQPAPLSRARAPRGMLTLPPPGRC